MFFFLIDAIPALASKYRIFILPITPFFYLITFMFQKHDINFLEVSAKDNANVKYGFESLISEIYHLHSFKQTDYECRQIQNGSVTLTSAQPYNAASISQEKLKQMREKCCSQLFLTIIKYNTKINLFYQRYFVI